MLGLMWTLIRRYQIRSSGKTLSTKQAMLQWLATIIPEKEVKNFTSSWNDGTVLCTLVDRIQPGLCPNHSVLDPKDGFVNCLLGMKLAKEHLGIPQILKPEHLSNPKVDELSVMTYISYFCKPAINDLLAWVQSKIPNQNITNFGKDWNSGVNLAALLESISPRSFPDWRELDPHNEISNLEKAMVIAEGLGAERVLQPIDFAAPDVDEINIVTYISRIRKCKPLSVPQKCIISGEGINKALVGKEVHLEVNASGAGAGELQIKAKSTSGKEIPVEITETKNGIFDVVYTPQESGFVIISVKWAGDEIADSPFTCSVLDPGSFKFYGPQITEGKLCQVGQPVTMFAEGIIDIKELEVIVNDTLTLEINPVNSNKAECTYVPEKVGTDQILVKLAGKKIPKSPFKIQITDPTSCKVISIDPIPACIGKTFIVKVYTGNQSNMRAISAQAVAGPQTTTLSAEAQGDNTLVLRYVPNTLGPQVININCAGKSIEGSPISLEVIDVSRVTIKGSFPRYIHVGRPISVAVNGSGNADNVSFEATSSDPSVLAVSVVKQAGGELSIQLNALSPGKADLDIKFGGHSLPNYPSTLNVCDASACHVDGKELSAGRANTHELFEFTVDATNAGDGELEVIPSGPNGRYGADVNSVGNGKYVCSFTAYDPGTHTIEILWSGQPIPGSPISIKFISSKFATSGDGLRKCTARQTSQFMLLGPVSGLLEDKVLQVTIEGNAQSSTMVPSLGDTCMDPEILVCVADIGQGNYQVRYCVPESGDYDIFVTCADEHIPGSPFSTYASPAPDPEQCHAFGPAIEEPQHLVIGKPIEFMIDSTEAGAGTLEVFAFEPTMASFPVDLVERRGGEAERLHVVKVDPIRKGQYTMKVKWSNQHIPGSPFKFEVGDPKRVRIISIPDREAYIPKMGERFEVIIDDTRAGPGETSVKVKLPNSTIVDVPVEIAKNHQKKFSFVPSEVGRIELLVSYSGVSLLEVPWVADVINLNAKAFEVITSESYVMQGEYVKFVIAGMKKSNMKSMVLKARNDENNHDAPVKVDLKKDGSATGKFLAKYLGKYEVTIIRGKEHINGSPFPVYVVNPDNAEFLKNLPSTLTLGRSYVVEIDGSECGPGELQYALEQREDSPCINCILDSVNDGVYKIFVKPVLIGEFKLSFQWEDFPINEAQVIHVVDVSKCQYWSPQLKDKRTVKENNPVTINIDASECGICTPELVAKGPQATYEVAVKPQGHGKFVATFTPWQNGDHAVYITIGNTKIPNSPMKFLVLKDLTPDLIVASGEGLRETYTGQENVVTIHGLESGFLERGQLTYNLYSLMGQVSVPADYDCVDNGNGIYYLTYQAHHEGEHCLEIFYEGQHISSSPFHVSIRPFPRADQCIASGRIIQPGAYLNVNGQPEIIIDSQRAGTGVLKASGRQPDGSQVRVFVNYDDRKKHHYLIFNPSKVGRYLISVEWNDTPIPGSPFTVNVVDPGRCYMGGEIPSSILIGTVKMITIDTTGVGTDDLQVLIDGKESSPLIESTIREISSCKYEIELEGCVVGVANISIQLGGYDISKSPFIVNTCDVNQCILEADHIRNGFVQAGCPFQFNIKTAQAGKSKPIIRPSQQGSGAQYVIDITTNDDYSVHTVVCTPHYDTVGRQHLDIIWVDEPIPSSPLSFSVFDPNNCLVEGLPDSSTFTPVIGENISFSVDQSTAGPGEVSVVAIFSDGTQENIPADKEGNVSEFKCFPKIPGTFELVLEINGVKILQTPWITEVPDPLQFRVTPPKSTGKVYEPVKLFITGITKQNQNFTVTAVHPDHKATVTIEPSKEGNTAVAVFTPETVGQYIVHVKHAFKNIEGSPFNVDVVDLNAIDIPDPPPERVAVNEECTIRLTTNNAGNGPLTCQLTSLAGDIPFTSEVRDLEDNVKEVSFSASSVGTGQVTLRWGDHVISPSPYTIHFIDSSKVTIAFMNVKEGKPLILGEPAEVLINCGEAGWGTPEVKITNKSSDVDSTAVNIQDKKDGTFIATITPWKSGVHELVATFSGYPVSHSPLLFEVQKIIDPRSITCFGEGLTSAIVKQPVLLTINAPVSGLVSDGSLKVSCIHIKERDDGRMVEQQPPSAIDDDEQTEDADTTGEEDKTDENNDDKCDAVVELTDESDGTYQLKITYPEVGDYVLYIYYKAQLIYQSPFNVSVKAAPNAANCKVFGASIDKIKKGLSFLVSQSIQFMIDTTSAGNGYLMCTVQDPSGDPIRVFSNEEVSSDDQRIAYLQFDPYEVGNYTVKVFWSSEAIPETPLIFNIVDPTRCLAQGLPIPNNGAVQIGEEIEFAIAPGTCGDRSPEVYLTGKEQDSRVELNAETITDNGVYKYRYCNEVAGSYNINVTIGGCHIPGSPYKCDVLDPKQFAIYGLNLKSDFAVVCELVSFKIQGQPPEGESFVVVAHGPLADLSCDLTQVSENLVEASFVPIEPGSYEVYVECANSHVTGSPFTVNVADPSKCHLLEVPSQIQVGSTNEMVVKTRGAGMGALAAIVKEDEDGNLANISIDDLGLDTYNITINPHKVSDIQLQITWGGYPIPQSPLRLSICDANRCKVYGQAILSKKGKVGEAISFSIVSSNAGNSKPVAKASGPSAQYSITPKDAGENKYEAQFTPWEIGEHSVEVLWGNTKIPDSPFVINVEKNIGGLPTCHATGEGLKKAIAGQQAMFTLVSNEIGLLEKNGLKVSVAGVRGHAEIEMTDMNDGRYQVRYRAPNPGAYIATVSYYDRAIPGSPFKISCVPGPDATKCRVEGLHPNSLCLTGNPIEFTVNSSEAGYGQLKVFVQGPQDYRPKVYVADDGKGSHYVKFDAMQQGRYLIIVAWSEKHIPGSPFKIKVHPAPDASKVVVDGPGVQNGTLGGESNFSIDTKQAGIGTLLIRVHGMKNSFKIEANPLKADDPRILIANYNPKKASDYTIFIRWSGVHVPGSPFKVRLDGGEGAEIDARKMIRGMNKRESTDGTSQERRRKVSKEEAGKRRRTSSSEKRVIVDPKTSRKKSGQRISRQEEVVVVKESRRIGKSEAASLPLSAGGGRRRNTYQGGFFSGLFGSSGSKKSEGGMTRTRSGSELPHVGPVMKPMKMRKNPSMGQMPLYVPQS